MAGCADIIASLEAEHSKNIENLQSSYNVSEVARLKKQFEQMQNTTQTIKNNMKTFTEEHAMQMKSCTDAIDNEDTDNEQTKGICEGLNPHYNKVTTLLGSLADMVLNFGETDGQ